MNFVAYIEDQREPGVFRRETYTAENGAGADLAIMERHRGRAAAALFESGAKPHPAGTRRFAYTAGGRLAIQLDFWRSLETSTRMKLMLPRALGIVASAGMTKELRDAAKAAETMITSGLPSFASALERLPNLSDKAVTAMVRSSEAGARLGEGFGQIVTILNARSALRRAVRSALVYPAIVLAMASALAIFLLVRVVPTFTEIYKELGARLPLPTRVLMGISDFIQAHPFATLGGFLALIFVGFSIAPLVTRPLLINGRPLLQRALLRLPVFGNLLRLSWEALFARTFASLLASKLLPPVALLLCRQLSWSMDFGAAVARIQEANAKGSTVHAAMARERQFFGPQLVAAIEVGEQTGNLLEMVSIYADTAEIRLKEISAALQQTLEPILIGFVAAVVGLIVAALFLPLAGMLDNIKP